MTITTADRLITAAYQSGLLTREMASEIHAAARSEWLGLPLDNARRAAMLRARYGISA